MVSWRWVGREGGGFTPGARVPPAPARWQEEVHVPNRVNIEIYAKDLQVPSEYEISEIRSLSQYLL